MYTKHIHLLIRKVDYKAVVHFNFSKLRISHSKVEKCQNGAEKAARAKLQKTEM